jgi:hypothetical protein
MRREFGARGVVLQWSLHVICPPIIGLVSSHVNAHPNTMHPSIHSPRPPCLPCVA